MTWIVLCHFTYEIIGHINRLDYPAKGIKINLLFHMCTEQVTHTFSCMIAIDMRTCNSLIWCYSYAVMFYTLCYSYWWSINIQWGLMASSHHQPTEQHTQPFTQAQRHTHAHTSKKNMTISAFQTTSICKVSKNKNTNHLERWHLP